jgi:diguanylate cyclase (GGDEF)-like protein
VRTSDVVARLSGDEFAILLNDVLSTEGLERVRDEIHQALIQPLAARSIESEITHFGGSVGEAIYPDDGLDADALIRKADLRMYGEKLKRRETDPAAPQRRVSDSTV